MGPAIVRKNAWITAVVLGLLFVALGAYMVSEGFAARDTVRGALEAEQVTTSSSAAVPDAPVIDVETAQAQEALITEHTLGKFGPYSSMERTDPNRDTYLKGLTLRNSLNLAVVGFKVSDLVAGVGGLVIVVGLSHIFLVAPMMFMVGRDHAVAVGAAH